MNSTHVEGSANSCSPFDPLLPACEALQSRFGVTRSTAYELLKSGQLETVRLGKKIMVAESELARFRASLKIQNRKKVA